MCLEAWWLGEVVVYVVFGGGIDDITSG